MTTRSADEWEMSRSCQSATFSRPTTAAARTTRASPQMRSDDDRVPLVRHRRRALLSFAERLFDLAHLGAREVADLERELVERRRAHGERREQLRVSVALDDLRRRRRRLQPEALARDPLDLGVDRRVLADGAGELADAHAFERARDARARAVELERPDRELQPERRRLGVDAVRAADAERQPVLLRARDDRRERAVEAVEQQRSGLLDLERERGVDDVRRGEAVVEPAAGRPELLGDGVDEGGRVVVQARFELGDALRVTEPSRARRISRNDVGRDRADLGPTFECGELDLEPARQLSLVRPDACHGRSRVAGDHWIESSRTTRRQSRARRRARVRPSRGRPTRLRRARPRRSARRGRSGSRRRRSAPSPPRTRRRRDRSRRRSGRRVCDERVVGRDLERLAADGRPQLGVARDLAQLGLDLLGRLAGNRAPLAAQQAARGVARELLAALDQRRVDRAGPDERMLRAGLQPLVELPSARRAPGPSSRSRRRRGAGASRARRRRASRSRSRRSPCARPRASAPSARRRSPRRRARVRAPRRFRSTQAPRRRPR